MYKFKEIQTIPPAKQLVDIVARWFGYARACVVLPFRGLIHAPEQTGRLSGMVKQRMPRSFSQDELGFR